MTFARRPGPLGRFNRRGLGSGGDWRATQLAGCALWLRADMGITKDGSDRVSAWADQSGEAVNFTQVTGANQPLWVAGAANGQPALRGDGGDFLLSGSKTWTGVTGVTIFVVAKISAATTCYFVAKGVSGTASAGGGSGWINTDKFFSAITDDPTNYSAGECSGAGHDETSPFVFTAQLDTTQPIAGGAEHAHWFNGVSKSVSLNSGAGDPSNMDGASVYGVLGNGNGSFPLVGDLFEVIYYTRLLSAGERSYVERKLGARYAIAVA